ncbi:MAG: YfmQ family protein, partial [Alicyclobacillus mali]
MAIPAWTAYLAAVVIPVLVLLINPANAWVNRWLSSVSIYPTLESSKTQSVSLNGAELSSDERLQFIQAWNQAIYITEHTSFTESNYTPIIIHIKEGNHTFSLTAFLLGDSKIQFIRHLRRRNI